MTFRDHFSGVADRYAASRPGYPAELVERLSALAPRDAGPRRAWDAGCGSGQLSTLLADVFDEVIATDASAEQITAARAHPRVEYRVAPAEASGLPARSVHLCVAAQAAHWFDLDAYYAEVRRVALSGGAVALVTYARPSLEPDAQPALQSLYAAVDPYWPPERKPVDELYVNLPFPFDEQQLPLIEMVHEKDLEGFVAFAGTWSSTQALVRARGAAALEAALEPLRSAWGDPRRRRVLRFPVGGRFGRVG